MKPTMQKVLGIPNKSPFVKDAFHSATDQGENLDGLKKKKNGTKFSPVYKCGWKVVKQKLFICGFHNKVA